MGKRGCGEKKGEKKPIKTKDKKGITRINIFVRILLFLVSIVFTPLMVLLIIWLLFNLLVLGDNATAPMTNAIIKFAKKGWVKKPKEGELSDIEINELKG